METIESVLKANGFIPMKKMQISSGTSMLNNDNFPKEYRKKEGKRKIECIQHLKKTIGKRYKDKTFLNFDKSKNLKAYEECRLYAKNFLSYRNEGKGLFLTGPVGTGKTHLTSAIIDYIARLYKRRVNNLIYTTSINLLSEIKFSFESKTTEDFVKDLETADLLVIDDIGTEKISDWAYETFYKIIDNRYLSLRPIILTSNLTDIELREKLSERIMSRIYVMCNGIKLTGKDYRINSL